MKMDGQDVEHWVFGTSETSAPQKLIVRCATELGEVQGRERVSGWGGVWRLVHAAGWKVTCDRTI
jgi:hypothetical protein